MSSSTAHPCRAFLSLCVASNAADEALMRFWAAETENLPPRVMLVNYGSPRQPCAS